MCNPLPGTKRFPVVLSDIDHYEQPRVDLRHKVPVADFIVKFPVLTLRGVLSAGTGTDLAHGTVSGKADEAKELYLECIERCKVRLVPSYARPMPCLVLLSGNTR